MRSVQESERLLVEEVEKRAAVSSELETAKEEIQVLRTVSLRFFIRRCGPGARNVQNS